MSPLDAFWHLINFVAPAVFIGTFSASMAKLLWRREMRAVPWRRLLAWALLPALAAAMGGLVITGRDGQMLTYLAMVVAAALGLWLASLVRRGH